MTIELPEPRDYIAGRWATPAVELADWVEDPNTGELVQHQRATTDDQIEAALAAADGAAGPWAAIDPEARANLLDALAAELARFNVAVAAVEPGNYKSQILASMVQRMEETGYSA
ncbi:MAG: aldehyde dehydrogenase family protein, partial [Acidimicrobiales bacterium]